VFIDINLQLERERESEAVKDRLEQQVELATAALGETRSELRALSAHLMTAQENEMRRIARELHDDFGQRSAILEMQVSRALEFAGQPELSQLLQQIREGISALGDGIRSVSHRLYPSALMDLGLVGALRSLADDFRSGGGRISLRLPGTSPDLSLD